MSDLSDDDKKLFQQAMQGVRRLKGEQKESILPPEKPARKRHSVTTNQSGPNQNPQSILSEQHMRQAQVAEHFHRGGLQHKQLRRLQQGKIDIGAQIDLHRLTLKEAEQSVINLINSAFDRGIQGVLIIHGKGYHSQPGQITLKHMVRYLLTQIDIVLAYQKAPTQLGGDGAVLVWLKRNKDE